MEEEEEEEEDDDDESEEDRRIPDVGTSQVRRRQYTGRRQSLIARFAGKFYGFSTTWARTGNE